MPVALAGEPARIDVPETPGSGGPDRGTSRRLNTPRADHDADHVSSQTTIASPCSRHFAHLASATRVMRAVPNMRSSASTSAAAFPKAAGRALRDTMSPAVQAPRWPRSMDAEVEVPSVPLEPPYLGSPRRLPAHLAHGKRAPALRRTRYPEGFVISQWPPIYRVPLMGSRRIIWCIGYLVVQWATARLVSAQSRGRFPRLCRRAHSWRGGHFWGDNWHISAWSGRARRSRRTALAFLL